jgi:RNA ligase
MKINRDLIESGYISERKHKEYNYFIYNYTAKTQYDKLWNEDTLKCRGLILDDKGNIIARPFSKFFNIEEYAENSFLGLLPKYNNFEVFEKLDGSLGILYRLPNGEIKIATRGSFDSKQALIGTELLNNFNLETLDVLGELSKDYTFLFEVIYPENRIVINYDFKDIILLAVIENTTGNEWSYIRMFEFCNRWNIPLVKKYNYGIDNLKDLNNLLNNTIEEKNKEGFVIRFDNGLRVKYKFEEYKRLHRILTGCSTKTIWELLKDNKEVDEILDRVPDEFYQWVKRTIFNLNKTFNYIETYCRKTLEAYPTLTEATKCGILSKVAGLIAMEKHSAVLFAMWRDKEYKNIIWRLIEPKYSKPFKGDTD